MKAIFFLVSILFVSYLPVQAQGAFGITGGIGMSSMHFAPSTYPILYTSAATNAIASGTVGALADMPLSKHIYFQAGADLSLRGAGRQFSYYTNDSFHESVNQTLYMYYADVPLSIVYKSGMQGRGRFIAGLGATFSYLFFGKNKLNDNAVYNDTAYNTNGTSNIANGSTIHAFDLGINMFAGYEMPAGLFLRAYFTTGVQDIGIGTEVDKNRMWGISAGFFFGKKRNINKNKEVNDLIDKSGQ
jgi:hypothetical protein